MTRDEYDEIEATAHAVLVGLLAGDGQWADSAAYLAEKSFDLAEAFQRKKKERLGDRPDHGI